MTKPVFYVRDYWKAGLSDSDAIEACMASANTLDGEKTIVFDGRDFLIERAILVSSNTHIIVDDCQIKQENLVFDNIFRGANFQVDPNDPNGYLLGVAPQTNIRITGKGHARLVGTDRPQASFHSGLDHIQFQVGDFWGWRTHAMSFAFCDGFELSGLEFSQTMGWAVCFFHCCNVHVHDLAIYSNVKNGDGINFRSGCHHCTACNISGFTSDDTVACTALHSYGIRRSYPIGNAVYPSEPFDNLYPEGSEDIHHIRILNIKTGGYHHGVICLAARGNQVHHIHIENIHETDQGHRKSTVKIYTGYGSGYTAGDIHDITIKNVIGQTSQYAFELGAEVSDVVTENIVQNNPSGMVNNL